MKHVTIFSMIKLNRLIYFSSFAFTITDRKQKMLLNAKQLKVCKFKTQKPQYE